MLDGLNYSYQIFETDYHIYLIVKTKEGEEIFFESTDPLYGFISDKKEIAERIERIRLDNDGGQTAAGNKTYYDFELNVLREVNLRQLAGLQYFNQAVQHYNSQQFSQSEKALSKGQMLYPAERFERFSRLLSVK